MWSIVKSLPINSLWQTTQTGSSILRALALALRHSLVSCHWLIVSAPGLVVIGLGRLGRVRPRCHTSLARLYALALTLLGGLA